MTPLTYSPANKYDRPAGHYWCRIRGHGKPWIQYYSVSLKASDINHSGLEIAGPIPEPEEPKRNF